MVLCGEELREAESLRSKPDYITYVPEYSDGKHPDSRNEHFLVVEGKDGSLLAVWTQGCEKPGVLKNPPNNHILFSKSYNDGVTWEEPQLLAGPADDSESPYIASWAFPMVSKSGRVYVLWNQNRGIGGSIYMHTGGMAGRYSDDHGVTWSAQQDIEMPHSPLDDPEGKIPSEWIVWQNPMRDLKGGYFVGYSHWVNKAVGFQHPPNRLGWTWLESVVEFVRFDNIDDDPEPKDLEIRYNAWGDKALRVPHWREPLLSVAQEPSLVRLPDGRLLCVMRTNSGMIWYSLSEDDGETWQHTRPLLNRDYGKPLLQPVACCPIYSLADGRYVLLYHNNRGDISPAIDEPEETSGPRFPAHLALGEYRPNADQPIWFSEPKVFIEITTQGVTGEKDPRHSVACYTSFTTRGNRNILWYPDRKCFLLGKNVKDEFLADMEVPD